MYGDVMVFQWNSMGLMVYVHIYIYIYGCINGWFSGTNGISNGISMIDISLVFQWLISWHIMVDTDSSMDIWMMMVNDGE